MGRKNTFCKHHMDATGSNTSLGSSSEVGKLPIQRGLAPWRLVVWARVTENRSFLEDHL